jgi:hypothetical protein
MTRLLLALSIPLGTPTDDSICRRCHRVMYHCSNGLYECRSDDCPPGTRKRRDDNLEKGRTLLKDLRLCDPSSFATAEDLAYVIELCNTNVPGPDGRRLEEIQGRLRQ